MEIIDFEKVRSLSKQDFETRFEKYKKFLRYLKDPQLKLKTVIITGSTGKGSTAEYLASILKFHKIKTGVYTSPHLLNVTERIKVDNRMITLKKLKDLESEIILKVKEFNKKYKIGYTPTFFELLTISAFLYFIEKKVEISILEVGLGGRLDATNVTHPILNIITPVCKDHTNFLGNSLKSIAKEKAEVIKENSCTVIATNDVKVLRIIKMKCKSIGSKLFIQNSDFQYNINGVKNNQMQFTYKDAKHTMDFILRDISIGAINSIALAIFSASLLTRGLKLDFVRKALKDVRMLGRFQKLKYKNKTFIIDGAHNQKSAQELVNTIKMYNFQDLNIIFSILCDKDINGVLKVLSKLTDNIIITVINQPREADIYSVYKIAKNYFQKITLMEKLDSALQYCLNDSKKYILITGSFYLCAEALQKIWKIE